MSLARNSSTIDAMLCPSFSANRPEFARGRDLGSEICEALRTTGKAALRRIEIRVEASHVTLQGSVRSFYLKQLAPHVAATVTGVALIKNQLSVKGGSQ